jgi:hypothetical protein
MNELSAFERRLAAGLDEVAGPRRAVDAISIARTAASRAPVLRSTPSRFLAVIGLEAVRGRRLGDLGVARSARPLMVLIAVALIIALALGALAVGSGLVRMSSVLPPAPSPSQIDKPLPSSTDTTALGSGSWSLTGKMKYGRWGETATLLPGGHVLVAGGGGSEDRVESASAELYDPGSGRWTETGSMHAPRGLGHSAALLRDGRVLVAGGDLVALGHPPQSTAELYDPATGAWTETGSMLVARSGHSATLLPDGKVLVAGGTAYNGNGGWHASKKAELYDPATETWSSTGSMGFGRADATAALLPDGNVLVVGGVDPDHPDRQSADLYDPRAGTWTATPAFAGVGACRIATPLLGGEVLVVCAEANGVRTSAALYDPVSRVWTTTASPPTDCCVGEAIPRGSFVRLPDGRVLWKDLVDAGEIYDPVRGTWVTAGGPTYPADPSWGLPYTSTDEGAGYYADTLTLLPDGRVLMTTLGAGLLYDPSTATPH